MSTTLFILRHAQTHGNLNNTFGGDPSLTEVGKEQARRVVAELPLNDITAIYSSKLVRAVETASIVKTFAPHIAKLEPRERLRERHFGNLEEQEILQVHKDINNKALVENNGSLWDVHLTDDDETFRESHERFTEELARIALNHTGEKVLIVSHGSIMRGLLVSLGFGNFSQLRSNTLKNTGIVVLDYDGKFSLKEVVGAELRK